MRSVGARQRVSEWLLLVVGYGGMKANFPKGIAGKVATGAVCGRSEKVVCVSVKVYVWVV